MHAWTEQYLACAPTLLLLVLFDVLARCGPGTRACIAALIIVSLSFLAATLGKLTDDRGPAI